MATGNPKLPTAERVRVEGALRNNQILRLRRSEEITNINAGRLRSFCGPMTALTGRKLYLQQEGYSLTAL
jgi:hypothetical protein